MNKPAKILICLLLSLALVASFTACFGGVGDNGDESVSESSGNDDAVTDVETERDSESEKDSESESEKDSESETETETETEAETETDPETEAVGDHNGDPDFGEARPA